MGFAWYVAAALVFVYACNLLSWWEAVGQRLEYRPLRNTRQYVAARVIYWILVLGLTCWLRYLSHSPLRTIVAFLFTMSVALSVGLDVRKVRRGTTHRPERPVKWLMVIIFASQALLALSLAIG
jgi:hypothetical protein